MSAMSRQERARKRARRAKKREEAERLIVAAKQAREERLARLGPLVEMFGEGSELLRAVERTLDVRCDRVPQDHSWFARQTMGRLVKRIFRPDGSVTRVHENCGFVMEMTFAGGGWVEERK